MDLFITFVGENGIKIGFSAIFHRNQPHRPPSSSEHAVQDEIRGPFLECPENLPGPKSVLGD